MARHIVHRRNGEVEEYEVLPDDTHLEPHFVTVTSPTDPCRGSSI